jgi:alpha-tubulin suppressor-like RCC1 family protein
MASGTFHNLLIDADGNVLSFGSNKFGQLGLGDLTDGNVPVVIESLKNATRIWCGSNHSFVQDSDSVLWAFGRNDSSELGLLNPRCGKAKKLLIEIKYDLTGRVHKQKPTKHPMQVIEVFAGNSFSFFVESDGTVYACGCNASGELGLGNRKQNRTLAKVDQENFVFEIV